MLSKAFGIGGIVVLVLLVVLGTCLASDDDKPTTQEATALPTIVNRRETAEAIWNKLSPDEKATAIVATAEGKAKLHEATATPLPTSTETPIPPVILTAYAEATDILQALTPTPGVSVTRVATPTATVSPTVAPPPTLAPPTPTATTVAPQAPAQAQCEGYVESLGCPTKVVEIPTAAFQPMNAGPAEKAPGYLLWLGDKNTGAPDGFLVLFPDKTWAAPGITSTEVGTCLVEKVPPPGTPPMLRGFSYIWCQFYQGPDGQLGWPRESERYVSITLTYYDETGIIIKGENQQFTLYSNGTWK
jgi:hypothetical protein